VFSILPNEFIIHFPHKASEARLSWNSKLEGSRSQQELNNEIYSDYIDWLNATYGEQYVRTPGCEGVKEKLTYSQRIRPQVSRK
jgi:hypothetical protein